MEWFWLFSVSLYCGAVFILIKFVQAPAKEGNYTPTVAILIAMRNEAANLPSLFQALEQLQYPQHLLEIWLLDDASTDATPQLAKAFAQQHPHVHYLRITHHHHGLEGKMNALAIGIQRSQGEIIFITDADCQPPPTWVQSTVQYFTNSKVGLIGGANIIRGKNWLQELQRQDLLYLLGMASALTHAGFPLSILGNNMAFRRQAYQAVGGFEAIGFSITEDAALLHAIQKNGQFAILFPLIPQTAIRSSPLPALQDVWRQRLRWAVGGKSIVPLWGWLLVLPGVIPRLLAWWAVPALPFYLGFLPFLGLLITNVLFISRIFNQLQLSFSLGKWLLVEGWLNSYLPLLAIITPFKRTVFWKNRRFNLQ